MPSKQPKFDLTKLSVRVVDYARIDPDLASSVKTLNYLPFAVRPDQGPAYTAEIDPGPIPPTFCHSWSLDLEGLHRFRLRVDVARTALNFDDGDRVTVYAPETGQSVELDSDADIRTMWIQLLAVPGSQPARAPERVYLILHTSAARYASAAARSPRRLVLKGLVSDSDPAAARVWLVGDTLNSTPSTPKAQQYWLKDGRGEWLPQPWKPAGGVSSTALIEEPRPEKGWYLLARFTRSQGGDDTPIWAVVHYNEQLSRLRVHVWSEVETATGLEVRLKLLAQDAGAKAGYKALEGAFFDDDMRTQTWSEVQLTIEGLREREWRVVETGVLFPMAKALPGAKDATEADQTNVPATGGTVYGHTHKASIPPVKNWYVPLYDSIAENQMRNVRLQVAITAFTRGEADLDFVGKGIGTAAQNLDDSGDPMLSVLKEAAKEGISAGKAGKGLYDGLKEWFQKENGQNAPLTGLLTLGGSAFGAIGAAVGAGIAIYKTLTQTGMAMELELRIRGSVQGSIYTPLATTVYECYLPGRFDAEEMHTRDGIAVDHPTLDCWIPRYDRSIGHVGFRYDPTETACRAVYLGPYEDVDTDMNITFDNWVWDWTLRCLWPAPRFDDPALKLPFTIYDEKSRPKWAWDASAHPARQDAFIPLVYNEFAEIVPLDPAGAARVAMGGAPADEPHQPTHRFFGKTGFAAHLTPEAGDIGFPKDAADLGSVGGWSLWAYHGSDWMAYDTRPQDHIEIQQTSDRMPAGHGYWLDAGPGRKVWPLRDFAPYLGIQTEDFGQLSVVMYDEAHTSIAPPVETVEFLGKDLSASHYRPFTLGQPWPLADLLYRWELVYFYYGRTRQQPSGAVPRRRVTRMLRSPVTVDVMRWDCDFRMEEFAWNMPGGSGRSTMLTSAPWPWP
jgi:hypothetical protein